MFVSQEEIKLNKLAPVFVMNFLFCAPVFAGQKVFECHNLKGGYEISHRVYFTNGTFYSVSMREMEI